MAEVVVSSSSGGRMEVDKEREKKEGSSEVVRWEKFLPNMVLRVLLVEADYSTRQIISALLRKCSYRVAAVPDGLMAWETLKDGPNNIDLILTEVDLPLISGYALLTLVMEHDFCKNIPVIMMSSHDSISKVLKCMLKGAADFLIKPVRRNELKNLWQHVWRRQTLTAGNIPPNSPNAQHRVEAASSASDHSSDCATSSHKRKECSNKGSDAQGSQPKCRSSSNLSNMEKELYEDVTLDKKSAIPESKTGEWSTRLQPVDATCNEAHNPTVLKLEEEHDFTKINIQDERAQPENDRSNASTTQLHNDKHIRSSAGVIDLIGTFDNGPKRTCGDISINDSANKSEFPSQLELSLRRFFPNSLKNQVVEERRALNHSNASAFSRYSSSKILQPLFPTSTSNYTEFKEDSSKSPELSSNQISQNANSVSQQQGSNPNGSQDIITNLVIGQSGKCELAYPDSQKLIAVSGLRLENICNGYGHVFSPLYYAQTGLPSSSPKLASQREQSPFPISTSIHSNPEIQDSEGNNRQSAETATAPVEQNMHQQNNMEHPEELKHGSPAAGQSTGSSMCNSFADHNNSSAYGSFSSRTHRNATFVAPTEKPTVPESSNDGGIVACDGFRGMDSDRFSQREAALTKFRLKRKDRCYEKKVRYQSRKRLAELRPRVKGQFVRQVQNDAPVADANDDV
ncbi:two-component response regulator-like APRR9 isoform X1 [Ricinus communis]|uniref:two-component response regulator-like APRR9 isoform X1 n=1 Tax=Ricinus communis TaxID=3988 RepID=UPI00077278A2|nr:two-component response regulator-like APRR9 isoform X1 [Ricinus communis]|eukprot:XP_015572413.1 two-component response regulator-like APRR9 isoform X1 [Ricinus communis]